MTSSSDNFFLSLATKSTIKVKNIKMEHYINLARAMMFGLLSGIATMAAFPMFHLSYLAFFSFAPLFIALEIFSFFPAMMAMVVFTITFYSYLLNWVKVFHPLALPGILFFVIIYHVILFWLYYVLAKKKTNKPSLFNPFLLAWLWTVLEYLRNVGFLRFPYGNIAYSQYEFLPFIQISEVTGYLGISFFIYLSNAFLAQWIVNFAFFRNSWISKEGRIFWKNIFLNRFAIISYVFIAVLGFGFSRINHLSDATKVIKESPLPAVIDSSEDLLTPNQKDKGPSTQASPLEDLQVFQYSYKPIRVSLIQPWFDYNLTWTKENRKLLFDKLVRLTEEAVKNHEPELIIWPETAILDYYQYRLDNGEDTYSHLFKAYFEEFAKKHQSKFLIGSLTLQEITEQTEPTENVNETTNAQAGNEQNQAGASAEEDTSAKATKGAAIAKSFVKYNSAIFLENDGRLIDTAGKRLLVPFAEYFPYKNILNYLGWLKKILEEANASNFTPFYEYHVFLDERTVPFGTMICYEDCFPEPALTMTLGGAKFLIIVTNDAWSYSVKSQMLHYVFSVFRAIENRRPILRVGNAGVTGLIQATGELNHDIPQFEEGQTTFSFRPLTLLTPYSTIGSNVVNLLVSFFLLIYLPYVFLSYLVRKIARRKKLAN